MSIVNNSATYPAPGTTQNLTVATTAYTAGDVVGGLLDLSILCGPGGGGVIRQVMVADAANQKEPYKLYLFDRKPTVIADDAAFAPVIADLQKLVGVIEIEAADYVTIGSLAYAIVPGKDDVSNEPVHHASGQLWGYLVATDTPDYAAATDLTLRIIGWKD